MTTQPMHKGAMAALFLKKAYDQAVKENSVFLLQKKLLNIWKVLSGIHQVDQHLWL